MKKRIWAAGFAAVMLLSLAGCGETPVPPPDGGGTEKLTLGIADVTAWLGCAASDFVPVWSDESRAEELTYSFDESKISLSPETRTVTALEAGKWQVTATSASCTAEFYVDCKEIEMDIAEKWRSDVEGWHPDWPSRIEGFKKLWTANGTENTTLFAGDSFFDASGFWTDFYRTYTGKDALCFGIGSTHSYNWEYLADALLKDMTPRNLVMHIGTNNVYDQGDTAEMATEALQRMFTVLHGRLPDTRIWWFTITQRSYDEMRQFEVSRVNEAMIEWCKGRSWITCIDTSPKITYDMLKDSIHPKLEYYSVFVEALEEAGIEIASQEI